MKIDLTCPVELWQYAMPTEDGSECTFVMNNLSDKVVTSVQVTLMCFDKEDMLLFKQTERIQGLKAGVGERFSLMLLPSQWREVEGVDLVIEKVWFDDATIWRRGNAPLTPYTPNALPNGRALDQLRFVAGKDAVGYPQVQDQVWLCVCGRANAPENERCCRCERKREAVFASFNQQNVRQIIAVHEQKLAEAARRAREENSLLIEEQEKRRFAKRRKRKQIIKLSLSAACIVAVVCVMLIWGLPTIRYNSALRLLRNGQFDDARAAFADMGSYRNAQTQLVECDYQEAKASLNAGGVEELKKAAEGFSALGDYSDSQLLWQQATYELGDEYLANGSYEEAAGMFQALGDYEDSAAKLSETTYQQAEALFNVGNYEVARVLFSGISDHKDAAVRAQACVYEQGKALLEAEDYEQATTVLSRLGAYEDALELAQQSSYQLALKRFDEERFEDAGNLFLQAGDYLDAVARANDCLYQLAQENKIAGNYEKAAELFARISGYLDSEGQAQSCVLEQARALMEQENYADAAALLTTIQTNADAVSALYECNYYLAMEAIEAGNTARAEELLENVDNYRDSERQLRTVRYQLAGELEESGDFEGAALRYEALGNYRNSVTGARRCNYQLAKSYMEQAKYQQAIDKLTELGNYEDSRALLQQATNQLATSYTDAGDTDAALEVLQTAPQGGQTADTLAAITLNEAKKLQDAGDYAGASELYLSLGDQEDAQTGYQACQYALAAQLEGSGNLADAGAAFMTLGDYEDAAERGARCYDAYYGDAAELARAASDDHQAVISALDGLQMTDLPESYSDLAGLYNEACYQYAEQLYREEKPYEALPYYLRITEYRDVADRKLTRRAYLILGEWVSVSGRTAAFRTDGTCDLMGETLFFRVSNFSLYTGTSLSEMSVTHKVSNVGTTSLSLRDIRDGRDVVYKFDRVGELDLSQTSVEPTASPTPAPTAAAPVDDLAEMLVTED